MLHGQWAAICGALTTFILSHAIYKPGTMQCGPEYPAYTPKAMIFHIIIQVSNIFIPLGIMLFAYFRMFREIKEHMQRLDENSAMDRAQIYQQQRTVTITLFIVLACFFLCWIPYCVYANYVTFEPDKSKIKGYANAIAYCFGYMNSACNPIIYAWRSPSFREGYKEILCQEPSYVVSDAKFELMYNKVMRSQLKKKGDSKDTIHDSSVSTGPLGRFSVFLNSVKIQPNQSSRRGSAESQISARISRNSTASNISSHKLLRKVTSKTAKGSSIIRRDDSIILVKNGKVVSVREDAAFKKTSSDDVFLPSPGPKLKFLPNSNSSANSSLNVLPECDGEKTSHVNENGHISVTDTDVKGDNSYTPLLGSDLDQSYEDEDSPKVENISKDIYFNLDNSLEKNEADKAESERFMLSEETSALLGQKIPRTQSETNIATNVFNFDFPDTCTQTHAKSLDNIYSLPLVRIPSNEHLDIYIHSSNHHQKSGELEAAVNS
ncbi:hypothetical protein KUTeg_008399 [Tegillarca granosa]|uniref:G-protein coupled receptors family 1 profile domain-containing protein n=1 Tax=Tegillarca granosa TaxID=220873 RepID=A0ABQ9F918_TEGGR|nr:hypothetical protein KUTeg_008399 [Tegillarca granosa]